MNRPVEDPSLYINREASWLAFNERVLEEANDEHNPLLERVKFLAISASNLDEFFEVRVAGLLQRIEEGFVDAGPDALTAQQERDLIAQETHEFGQGQQECWSKLLPALAKENIRVLELKDLDPEQVVFIDSYCEKEVDPLLTPVTVDPSHPFPRVLNKALCIALLLKRKRRATGTYMGVVTVPRVLPRLVRLPSKSGIDYIFLADLLTYHAASMYRGYDIISAASFRVTRNSNLYVEEEEARNLLESVRTELHKRRKGDAVRLEIETEVHPEIARRLQQTFELEDWQVFYTKGPVNLSRLFNFYELTQRPDLKYKSFVARELRLPATSNNIFSELRKHDILLHHPFDSFDAVVDFIESAASDPDVISLKQTIYRTSQHSPIVGALISAAAAEKEVIAVLELKARFDEASNIEWARTMEDAGVQVYHGLVGLKTHGKISLLVRHDPDGVTRRYAHIGTGNYNPTTSRFYTDVSLLTSSPQITSALHSVFNYLTAYSEAPNYAPLAISPIDLAATTLSLIQRETDHARAGRPARIVAKMNALLDKNVIQALYRASQEGVKIDLIVRGMCSLRPGVTGVSENIVVRSIVGRFLEHSRIFYFENGGDEEIYISSADWMPRNLYERVEVLCPLLDPSLRQRMKDEILAAYMADNTKVRFLDRQGRYARMPRRRGQERFSAQDFLIALAEGTMTVADIPEPIAGLAKTVVRERAGQAVSR